jgi:hypothetical protein
MTDRQDGVRAVPPPSTVATPARTRLRLSLIAPA